MIITQDQKIDPHNSKKYLSLWKEKTLLLTDDNSTILKEYVEDMCTGMNMSGSVKGARSTIKTLASARQIEKLLSLLELHFNIKDVRQLDDTTLLRLFSYIVEGKILNTHGKPYKSTGDYASRFKAFWHWHMKREKKKGIAVLDITTDLDADKRVKPPFVYFDDKQLQRMIEESDYETRTFMLFLFDTGIRSPTESLNIRVSDFRDDYQQLNIRDGISKTFGRQIKLMMCREAVKNYVKDNHLSGNDLLFSFEPATINKRLKKIGKKVLGEGYTVGRKKGSELTMYDFRHSSGCYWLPRYKSESSLKYRFGWKKSEMIYYYTELLGMKDTIQPDDMLIHATKTELEKRLAVMETIVNKLLTKNLELAPDEELDYELLAKEL